MTRTATSERPSDDSPHWADQRERGSPPLMRLTAWMIRRLGRRVLAPVIWLIVLYFYLTGRRARGSIARYQARLRAAFPAAALPRHAPVYRQYMSFAQAMLDKLDAWQGKIRLTDIDLHDPADLHAQMGVGRGQILVGSHLGNVEVCRALVTRERQITLNVLVHHKHAQGFNQLVDQAGAAHIRLFEVSELDAGHMMELAHRLDRGEWITIAGDRVPTKGERVVEVDFLGARAPLPQGPWLLAGLLDCPVNLLTCTREAGRHRVAIERLTERVQWTRATREQQIARWAQVYADRLAQACAAAPTQWFNFFPFWSDDAQPRRA